MRIILISSNVAANYGKNGKTSVFVTVKHLTDSRSCGPEPGLLPGMPRLVQMGVVQRF